MKEFFNPLGERTDKQWADSKMLKAALFVGISLVAIVLLPVAIIAYPFVFAWQSTKAITDSLDNKSNTFNFDTGNKLDSLMFDFSNWFGTETGKD